MSRQKLLKPLSFLLPLCIEMAKNIATLWNHKILEMDAYSWAKPIFKNVANILIYSLIQLTRSVTYS